MGDPARALLFKAMFQEIQRLKLVENTADVGSYLYSGLKRLQERYTGQIMNLRGQDRGTFIAFDSPKRDTLIRNSKAMGLNIGGCGEQSIRLRPMLVFQKRHGKFSYYGCVA